MELGSVNFNLKDFKSEHVTRIAFNLPIIGQHNFLKCIACINEYQHMINVTRINLQYYKGLYTPTEDYFASDFLLDEWIPLIPDSHGNRPPELASSQPSFLHRKRGSNLSQSSTPLNNSD